MYYYNPNPYYYGYHYQNPFLNNHPNYKPEVNEINEQPGQHRFVLNPTQVRPFLNKTVDMREPGKKYVMYF
ncbi:hypothetical protein CS953_13645 [Bacillus safensis]|uniref:hypothetical protein n=1 Tax=Bacillus safensis TaxID=561879 RepID=UPI000EF29646|nr:hypothetical protein [Bacillus safensis]AYJ90724.1 hypothetical protein CS953_13645 [Bacillus safensis]